MHRRSPALRGWGLGHQYQSHDKACSGEGPDDLHCLRRPGGFDAERRPLTREDAMTEVQVGQIPESSVSAVVRDRPRPTRQSRPVVVWGSIGAFFVALQAFVYSKWIITGDAYATTTGRD